MPLDVLNWDNEPLYKVERQGFSSASIFIVSPILIGAMIFAYYKWKQKKAE
jgi:hypothetical protein